MIGDLPLPPRKRPNPATNPFSCKGSLLFSRKPAIGNLRYDEAITEDVENSRNHKLLHIIYGVLKHGQPFNPNHHKKAENTP